MKAPKAEDVLSPERLEYERSKIAPRPKNRVRLTIQDFEDVDICLPRELLAGLKKIEDPIVYMEYFFKMLSFVTPKIAEINIQGESPGATDFIPTMMDPNTLVAALRQEREAL